MSGLRLDLIVRTYPEGDRWSWRLWSGSRIVSSSGAQLFSRRIDCARGAEVGAGLHDLRASRCTFAWRPDHLGDVHEVVVRIIDERGDS